MPRHPLSRTRSYLERRRHFTGFRANLNNTCSATSHEPAHVVVLDLVPKLDHLFLLFSDVNPAFRGDYFTFNVLTADKAVLRTVPYLRQLEASPFQTACFWLAAYVITSMSP